MKRLIIAVILGFSCAGAFAQAEQWIEVRGGAWSPDARTLASIQGSIEGHARREAARQRRELEPWERYRFQYRGYVERGRALVRVRGLCQVLGEDALPADFLDSAFYDPLGGGSCYFQTVYDPGKARFSRLHINPLR